MTVIWSTNQSLTGSPNGIRAYKLFRLAKPCCGRLVDAARQFCSTREAVKLTSEMSVDMFPAVWNTFSDGSSGAQVSRQKVVEAISVLSRTHDKGFPFEFAQANLFRCGKGVP
jgi:hypothetical protein